MATSETCSVPVSLLKSVDSGARVPRRSLGDRIEIEYNKVAAWEREQYII